MNTAKINKITHSNVKTHLRDNFRYLDETTRLRLLNIVETAARNYYTMAGGRAADFERIFNGEKIEQE